MDEEGLLAVGDLDVGIGDAGLEVEDGVAVNSMTLEGGPGLCERCKLTHRA